MKIAYDLDGVLSDTNTGFISWMNEHGHPEWRVEDVTDYKYEKVFNVTPEFIKCSFDDFFRAKGATLPVMEGAYDAVSRLQRAGHTLFVVSSRQPYEQLKSYQWLREQFGDAFQGVHCLGRDADKGVVCGVLGIEMLLDDHPNHVLAAQEQGVNGVLFDALYNREAKVPRVIDHRNFRKHVERMCAEQAKKYL